MAIYDFFNLRLKLMFSEEKKAFNKKMTRKLTLVQTANYLPLNSSVKLNSDIVFHFHTIKNQITGIITRFWFNCDLNRGCLVYMFSLRVSGSKFLIDLRRQFRICKFFSCTENFSYTGFCGICSLFSLFLKLLNYYFENA